MSCCGGSKVKGDKFSNFADACYTGNVEKMRERLKIEANKKNAEDVINKCDDGDNRLAPLHKAAQSGKAEAVRFLLDNGADPRILTKSGETPLHVACFHRQTEIVKILLESAAKADVNTKEKIMEMTPLHIAVWRGSPDISDLLIKAGADATQKDKNGQDCYEMAEFWSHQEEEKMASPTAQHRDTRRVLQSTKA